MKKSKLAIIAGGGRALQQVASYCQITQQEYIILGIQGAAEVEFVTGHPHVWITLGTMGATLELLRQFHITHILFIGSLKRPSLMDLHLDTEGRKWLKEFGLKIFAGDDGLLRLISKKLEALGYTIVGIQELLKEVILEAGLHTHSSPTLHEQHDIQRGLSLLQTLAAEDVGQAVIVQEGVILGIEAREGTQSLLSRCGLLKLSPHGGVLVKIPKHTQDKRFDLPTIGPHTAQAIVEHNYAGIAISAKDVLVLELPKILSTLNEHHKFLVCLA